MKKMINNVDDVISDTLSGMALAHPELEISMDPMYILNPHTQSKVALISGGGSGHEPMHGGFVGTGMLDGACPGQMFTSPTPNQMYECALKADKGEGVLFLIKNYTGDVLNFETATELLAAEGIQVQTALIDDDVAVKDSLYTAGRRGVACTVLAEKLLGAATQKGYSLEQCALLAQRIRNRGRSIGVALHACTVPAAGKPSFNLTDDEIEFGVGIHGEPGIARVPFTNGDTITKDMLAQIFDNTPYTRTIRQWNSARNDWSEHAETTEPLQRGDAVIVLVNSLGSTPLSELYSVYRTVYAQLEEHGIRIQRNLIGTYCSSIDMQGLSITVLKVDEELLSLWDAPVNTPALRWGL